MVDREMLVGWLLRQLGDLHQPPALMTCLLPLLQLCTKVSIHFFSQPHTESSTISSYAQEHFSRVGANPGTADHGQLHPHQRLCYPDYVILE